MRFFKPSFHLQKSTGFLCLLTAVFGYLFTMNKLPPGSPGDLQRHLFQISEALSLEERNLRNNPSGLSRAADFIEEFFSRSGFGVTRQTFQVDRFDCHNLEAVPRDFCGLHEPHWILGAHYDSAPGTLGADDNISAVAILLETARLLMQSDNPPRQANSPQGKPWPLLVRFTATSLGRSTRFSNRPWAAMPISLRWLLGYKSLV